MKLILCLGWGLIISGFSALAAGELAATNGPSGAGPNLAVAKLPDAGSAPVRVTNTVSMAGEAVRYVAETGMLPLLKPDGTSRASVFYTAYTRIVEGGAQPRPVMFCFNGGPGSASLWLHLGALGPRRVRMNEDGSLPKPPGGLVDNEFSLLHATDLVFIDPVATGYSRVAKDEKAEQFFGEEGDISSIGEFIRLWTTRHDRWLSPKYLCGESYGVFRSAGLADYLRDRYGMYLNGLVLVSGLVDFGTIYATSGNDVPYLVGLPALTAAAHFHKRLPADLQADLPKALAAARVFARGDYGSALQQGAALAAADRERVIAQLARFTGLKPALIADNNLRIDPGLFRKQLLHAEGLVLGAYDARLTGRDGDPSALGAGFDPSAAAVMGPFSAAMNAYVRGELKFENDLPYELLTPMPGWTYNARSSFASTSERLASVMNQNPHMQVLVLGGVCDLVCPIDAMHYSLDHMGLAAAYRGNIHYAEFDAGHMMYINRPDLEKLQKVISQFVRP